MLYALRLALGLVALALAGFFALAFYVRYWQWRDCFNELGRCYDPISQDVYLEQSGAAWGLLTVLCVTVSASLLWRLRR